MPINVLFGGVPVADFDSAVDWYGRLLGRPPDIPVKHDEVMWRIADAAWLYVLEDTARAGNTVVTLAVDDLDRAVGEIEGRGIRRVPIETIGDASRKATFADLEGNRIAFIEVKPPKSEAPTR